MKLLDRIVFSLPVVKELLRVNEQLEMQTNGLTERLAMYEHPVTGPCSFILERGGMEPTRANLLPGDFLSTRLRANDQGQVVGAQPVQLWMEVGARVTVVCADGTLGVLARVS